MVECTALEMRRGCKLTVGSNPTLSAIYTLIADGRFVVDGTLVQSRRATSTAIVPRMCQPANTTPRTVPEIFDLPCRRRR